MIVGLSSSGHPVAGETGLDVGEVDQFTLIILGGIVDIRLQGPLQLQLLCRDIRTSHKVHHSSVIEPSKSKLQSTHYMGTILRFCVHTCYLHQRVVLYMARV